MLRFPGAKISFLDFSRRCYARGKDGWCFKYPLEGVLPVEGILSEELMKNPDMFESTEDDTPCLLVIKNGNSTETTIGRANGVCSITREYYPLDMTVHRTSMEWPILNYGSEVDGRRDRTLDSNVFSDAGDSGAAIADLRGRLCGMITARCGSDQEGRTDITYATPFWWLLERIREGGFPNVNLDVTGSDSKTE